MVNKFIESYYSNASETKKNDVKRFLENLENLRGKDSLSDILQDKDMLCESFFMQQRGTISRSHYQKIKEYLLNLFNFTGVFGTVPTREEVIKSRNFAEYFRSLEALLDFIDNVGWTLRKDYNPAADLVRVKGMCVLGWMGFSLNEISALKKKDLVPIDNIGFKISTNRDIYEIYGEPYSVLYYLRDLKEYNGLVSGKKTVLQGHEEYLFSSFNLLMRKRNPADEQNGISVNHLIQILSRFNNDIPKTKGKIITFRNLHKNAMFVEIYKANPSQNEVIPTIAKVMNCTKRYASTYKAQYLYFAEAMNKGKI